MQQLQHTTPAPTTTASESCGGCGGTGRRLTPEWRHWWDLYAEAEEDHLTEQPEQDWPTSAAFWDVHELMPATQETVPCAGCHGRGRIPDGADPAPANSSRTSGGGH